MGSLDFNTDTIGLSDLAAVALPGSELYQTHVKRWSNAAEKPAVSLSSSFAFRDVSLCCDGSKSLSCSSCFPVVPRMFQSRSSSAAGTFSNSLSAGAVIQLVAHRHLMVECQSIFPECEILSTVFASLALSFSDKDRLGIRSLLTRRQRLSQPKGVLSGEMLIVKQRNMDLQLWAAPSIVSNTLSPSFTIRNYTPGRLRAFESQRLKFFRYWSRWTYLRRRIWFPHPGPWTCHR